MRCTGGCTASAVQATRTPIRSSNSFVACSSTSSRIILRMCSSTTCRGSETQNGSRRSWRELQEAEAVAEGIVQRCHVTPVERLDLAFEYGAGADCVRGRLVDLVDFEVQVHRRPMPVVTA